MSHGFRILFLDLDDTLYPSSTGLWTAIGVRILQYMVEVAGVPAERAAGLRDEYFHRYGTTLTGLRIHQAVDPLDYLRFVHAIPVEDYLHPDPVTKAVLASVPLRKVVLTNADRWHAGRVLKRLGLTEVIDQIIDVIDLEWVHKPEEAAYRKAMALAGVADARSCLLLDDLLRNLEPASKMGMTTVLVGAKDVPSDSVLQISSVQDLRVVLDRLGIRADRRQGSGEASH